ncbi:MAG TPA: right-handed parallel beta-helix repeat-containing protein, partial [Acidimicrobiales bacterium]|nr:right-handed parallel beta-helix repeat-containing protein [Acidimicrobiales bacterium]
AEGVSGLTIKNSTVQGNGVNPNQNLDVDKAIQLVAVTNSTVSNNTVTGNTADGGISVTDEGGNVDPGAPHGPAAPAPSTNVTITGNHISANYSGCALVIESWIGGPGAGVSGITASNNVITGAPFQFGPNGPVIGQIVVATDAPGAHITNTTVSGNTITGSVLSGITVHSNAPGDAITGTSITGNTLINNNWGFFNGAPQTDAIALEINDIPAPVTPILSGTTIKNNVMKSQFVGVWQSWQVTGTTLSGNTFDGKRLLYTQPVPATGYTLAASDGGVFTFGNAHFYGSTGGVHLNSPVVGIAETRDQGGYTMAAADGGVFNFGDASFYGSMGGTHLNAPVVGIAATPGESGGPGSGTNGLGYWLVARDGGVFSFGDASFHGSTGGVHLNAPIVGIAPTTDGGGYWLVASDGGVFAFGDAAFHGSTGGVHLNAPIVGIAPTPDGMGYWLTATDGGVFAFGDAQFMGSTGGVHLNSPVTSISATHDGQGYWLMARDGGIFNYGDAKFFGSLGSVHLNAPIVAGMGLGSNPVSP